MVFSTSAYVYVSKIFTFRNIFELKNKLTVTFYDSTLDSYQIYKILPFGPPISIFLNKFKVLSNRIQNFWNTKRVLNVLLKYD